MSRSAFDIIGPAMIGPSSSHTAGAVRIGLIARHLLGAAPKHAKVELHGSFASTGIGHATDRAIVAGLLGWAPDDPRLKESLETAANEGLDVLFAAVDLGETIHPNTARILLSTGSHRSLSLIASSVGGGSVEIFGVDDYSVRFSAELPTVAIWHDDRPGFLAHVTAIFACVDANIATIQTARRHRAAEALTIVELDLPPLAAATDLLRCIGHVRRLESLPPLS